MKLRAQDPRTHARSALAHAVTEDVLCAYEALDAEANWASAGDVTQALLLDGKFAHWRAARSEL